MTRDSIIDEIHRIRRELWQEGGATSEKFADFLMRSQERHRANLVSAEQWKHRKALGQEHGSDSSEKSGRT